MPRTSSTLLAVLVMSAIGCGTSPTEPEMTPEELTAAQNRDQKEVDHAERQYQKETRAAHKGP